MLRAITKLQAIQGETRFLKDVATNNISGLKVHVQAWADLGS